MRRWTIRLTLAQMLHAGTIGVTRMAENIVNGRHETHGSERNHSVWGRHVEAAMGEYAFALCAGLEWGGKGIIFGPDVVGTNFEIRTAESGRLIVHPGDDDDAIVWFVVGSLGAYRVSGWTTGKQAKNPRLWTDPTGTGRPAFFVPERFLQPPESYWTPATRERALI